MTMNAYEAHTLTTIVVGSISFLIAVVVIWRARHDDAPHPVRQQIRARRRRVVFATFIALGFASTTHAAEVTRGICWFLPFLVECLVF